MLATFPCVPWFPGSLFPWFSGSPHPPGSLADTAGIERFLGGYTDGRAGLKMGQTWGQSVIDRAGTPCHRGQQPPRGTPTETGPDRLLRRGTARHSTSINCLSGIEYATE